MTEAIVRQYRNHDEAAVRRICGDTALFGQEIERLMEDREFVVDALIAYYTRFEPQSLLVAGEGGKIVGYLAGCVDTERYERTFKRRILPRLIARFVTSGHWHRPLSWRVLAALGRSGRERERILHPILKDYPAHCHINIAEGCRRGGIGSLLFDAFLAYLGQHSAPGIHVSTSSKPGSAFFLKKGFGELGRYPAPRLPVDTPQETLILGKKLREQR